MTPQQLIDLPFYGMAEKELRKAGKWLDTPLELLYQVSTDDCNDDANIIIDKAINAMEAK